MSEDNTNTLLKIGNSVIQVLDADSAHASLPKNSWQVSCSVDGSILYFKILLNYDILFTNRAHELADPNLWIIDVANKAGGVAHRTGKLLIRDGKKDELILLSEATFTFKCNQNNADDLVTSCKVKNLIAVLTSNDANISLEARIMSIMDM